MRAGQSPAARRRFVGDEFGLDHHAHGVDRLDFVLDRRDRSLGEGDQARGGDLDALPGRRRPVGHALEQTSAKVEFASCSCSVAVANVEGLVVDEQADDLGVGDVDHDLVLLGIAVTRLGVGQRPKLVARR